MSIKFEITANTYAAKIRAEVETAEQAQDLAAIFPKSVKAIGKAAYRLEDMTTRKFGVIEVEAIIKANKNTGEKNEAGIKRLKSAIKAINAAGFDVEYAAKDWNNVLTEAEFLEVIA